MRKRISAALPIGGTVALILTPAPVTRNSRYEDIESGLKVLEAEVRRLTRLGCVGIGWSLACG